MKIKKTFKIFFMTTLVVALSHCASELDQKIEQARALLDKGKYAAAIEKIQAVATANPDNAEAQYILAAAQIGKAVLGDGNSYVGKVADLLEDQKPGESAYATFSRIAPSSAADVSDLNTARDSLIALTSSVSDDSFLRDVYFELYIARLFEIASAVTVTGVGSDDVLCNANSANPNKDGIPDEYDPVAVAAIDTVRFQDNLDTINSDGQKAGLPTDFGLNSRITEISADLATAGDLTEFLKTAFDFVDDGSGELLCVP